MKQNYIYKIENNKIKKVYAKYERLLYLLKQPNYYSSYSDAKSFVQK